MGQLRARSRSRPDCRLSLLGIPLGGGAPQPGAAHAPSALRAAGLIQRLGEGGHTVEDHGDLAPALTMARGVDAPPPNVRNYDMLRRWTCAISEQAYAIASSGALPLFVGGDHSISMGSINGVARHWNEAGRPLFVLWIDAHADFNTPSTSPTGNLHGMAAGFACGERGLDDLLAGGARVPVSPSRLHLFGLRSVDPLEHMLLHARRIAITPMAEIAAGGGLAALERFLATVQRAGGVLHVSFDVDVIDPRTAPGVGTPVPGGLELPLVRLLLERLSRCEDIVSVDVVELDPLRDRHEQTTRLTVDLLARLLAGPAAIGSGRRFA